MIEILQSKDDRYEGTLIIDGRVIKGLQIRFSRDGNRFFIDAYTPSEDVELLAQHRFIDLPQNLSSLSMPAFSITSSYNDELRHSFVIERSDAGTLSISIRCRFNVRIWKHLWSIQEYIDEFQSIVEREGFLSATWRASRLPATVPIFFIEFTLEDVKATIKSESLKHEAVMQHLHKLTESSLASKLQNPKVEQIIRSIEFPPEYYQSGVTILSYFAEVLRHKNLSEQVKVSIEQSGLDVRLVIESPTGQREEIERTLETYALVVTGRQPVESLTTDPYEILELKNQVRIANVQIENQREMLALRSGEVTYLKSEIEDTKASLKRLEQSREDDTARFMSILGKLVEHNTNLSTGFKELAEQAVKFQNKRLADALESLQKMIERGVRKEDEEEAVKNLQVIKQEDPTVFSRVCEILIAGGISGATSEYLYTWLQYIVSSIPK